MGAGAGCYIVAGFTIVQSLVPAHDIANAVGAMTIGKSIDTALEQTLIEFIHSTGLRHGALPRHIRLSLPEYGSQGSWRSSSGCLF